MQGQLFYGFQRVAAVELVQKACGNLGVGLGDKFSFQTKFICEIVIIFDDAVVDQRHPPGPVGMGVGVGYPAVGGPSGVADAAVGAVLLFGAGLAKRRHFPCPFDEPDVG